MPGKVKIHQHLDCLNYSFGGLGWFDAQRGIMALELIREKGLFERGVEIVKIRKQPSKLLYPYHTKDYVEAVEKASKTGIVFADYGLNTAQLPLRPEHFNAALTVVAATTEALRDTWDTGIPNFAPYGGLHHAKASRAGGFCIFNDLAVAAAKLHEEEQCRITILDLDLHASYGTDDMLRAYPLIQKISLQGGAGESQYRGNEQENIHHFQIARGSNSDEFLSSLELALGKAMSFQPDILLVQSGVNMYYGDEMKTMKVTMDGFYEAYRRIWEFAKENTGSKITFTGGGGYGYKFAAPRAWTLLVSVLLEEDLNPDLSDNWRSEIANLIAGALEKEKMDKKLKKALLPQLLQEIPHSIME